MQAGSGGFHAFFGGVFFQEGLRFGQFGLRIFIGGSLCLGLFFLQEGHHDFVGLLLADAGFFTGHYVFDGLCEEFDVDVCALLFHFLEAAADVDTHRVAGLLFGRAQC